MLAGVLRQSLGGRGALVLALDSYYRDLSHMPPEERAASNFDEPQALDIELFAEHLLALKRGMAVEQPVYDFAKHTRQPGCVRVAAVPFLIVEGLFVLTMPAIRRHLDVQIYVDAPEEVCLRRRIVRDVQQRGRTRESVRRQFCESVQPMAVRYVLPARKHAHLVVNGEGPLEDAVAAVRRLLDARQ